MTKALFLFVLFLVSACAAPLAQFKDAIPTEVSCEAVTDYSELVERVARDNAEPLAELDRLFQERKLELAKTVSEAVAKAKAGAEAICAVEKATAAISAAKEQTQNATQALAVLKEAAANLGK